MDTDQQRPELPTPDAPSGGPFLSGEPATPAALGLFQVRGAGGPGAVPDMQAPRHRWIGVLLVLAFLVTFGARMVDSFTGSFSGTSRVEAPVHQQAQGRYDVHVESVRGEVVTVVGPDGEPARWQVTDPAVARLAARHRGDTVTAFWRTLPNGVVVMVGLVGPHGAAFPDRDARDSMADTAPGSDGEQVSSRSA